MYFMFKRLLKKFFVPILLVATSITLILAILEFLFFENILNILPLKTHWYLDEGIQVYAQSSKFKAVPLNYVLIVGDSYAEGQGDWFRAVNKNKRSDFHSAHLIHKNIAKDVITFGAGGSGSLRGIVGEPIARYTFANSTSFELESPEHILVYFYEGNDLNDNIRDIKNRFSRLHKNADIYDSQMFQKFINDVVVTQDPLFYRATNHKVKITNKLFLLKFLIRLSVSNFKFLSNWIDNNFKRKKSILKINEEKLPKHKNKVEGQYNKILLLGKTIGIPDRLQSPALELTSDEIDMGIYVFQQAVIYLKKYFTESKIAIVYIPSPLSSYNIVSETVHIQTYENREDLYERQVVIKSSDKIASRIKNVAKFVGVNFIDTRDSIRRVSEKKLLHGPTDWKHLNKTGYTVLSDVITIYLNRVK